MNWLPLQGLVDYLRSNGFVVGVDTYLRMQRLLNALPPGTAASGLKTLLAPIIAHEPDAQALFYRLFDAYVAALGGAPAPAAPAAQAPTRPKAPARRLGRWVFVGLACVLVGLIGYAGYVLLNARGAAKRYYAHWGLYEPGFARSIAYAVRAQLDMEQPCDSVRAEFEYQPQGRRLRLQARPVPGATYEWVIDNQPTDTLATPAFEYQAPGPGEYAVALIVRNRAQCQADTLRQIVLLPDSAGGAQPEAPLATTAFFAYNADPANKTVLFRDASQGRLVAREWDFGDGTTASDPNPTHVFADFGSYPVRLRVRDAAGGTDELSQIVPLRNPETLPLPALAARAPISSDIGGLALGWWGRNSRVLLPLLAALGMAGAVAFWVYRRHRTRYVLTREKGMMPPFTWVMQAPHGVDVFSGEDYRRVAQQLRRRRVGESTEPDVPASINATIATGGYPSLRFRPNTRPSEYLVLIDRESPRDHQARMFDVLVDKLVAEDVLIDRYYFRHSPAVCRKRPGDRPVSLAELRVHYPNHRLLLMGNGAALVDPVSGKPTPLAAELDAWPEKALITPASTANWGLAEVALARDWIVLPASSHAFAQLVDELGKDVPSPLRAWLHNGDVHVPANVASIETDAAPTAEEVAEWMADVRQYLGEKGYLWLASLAVYPELHWDMTLFIGQKIATGLATEANLLRLLRVPFFRAGALPDALRVALIESLTPAQEAAARAAVIETLQHNAPPAGSMAAEMATTHMAAQHWMMQAGSRSRMAPPMAEHMADMAEAGMVEDMVVMRALRGWQSPLMRTQKAAFVLPPGSREWLFREGMPAKGIRSGWVYAACALLVLLALLLPTRDINYFYPYNGRIYYLRTAADSAALANVQGGVAYAAFARDTARTDSLAAAFGYFNLAASLMPAEGQYRYNLGLARLAEAAQAADWEAARQDFAQALGLSPLIDANAKVVPVRLLDAGGNPAPQSVWMLRSASGRLLLRPDLRGLRVLRTQAGGYVEQAVLQANLGIEIRNAAFSPDDSLVAVAGADLLALCNARTGGVVWQMQTAADHLAFDPAGGGLMFAQGNTLKIAPLKPTYALAPGGIALGKGLGKGQPAQALTPSRNVLDLRTIATTAQPITALAVSPDGLYAVVGDAAGLAVLLRLRDGAVLYEFEAGRAVVGVAFAPSNQRVALLDNLGRVHGLSPDGSLDFGFDARIGQENVYALAFNPDGGGLVTLGGLMQVRYWGLAGNERLAVPAPAGGSLQANSRLGVGKLTFLPDGTLHATRGEQWAAHRIDYAEIAAKAADNPRIATHLAALHAQALASHRQRLWPQAAQQWSAYWALDTTDAAVQFAQGYAQLAQPLSLVAALRLDENIHEQGAWTLTRALARMQTFSAYPELLPVLAAASRVQGIRPQHRDRLCALANAVRPGGCAQLGYEAVGQVSEGMTAFRQGGKWGYLNEANEVAIAPQFASAGEFRGALALVLTPKGYLLIDKSGAKAFDAIGVVSQGFKAVKKGDKWGIVNTGNQVAVSLDYDAIISIEADAGTAVAVAQGKQYTVNLGTGQRTELNVPEPQPELGNIADAVNEGKRTGVGSGPPAPPPAEAEAEAEVKVVGQPHESRAIAMQGGKYGFVDASPQAQKPGAKAVVVIAFRYEAAKDFKQGRAAVQRGGKWGFVDAAGNEVIPCKYDAVLASFTATDKAGQQVLALVREGNTTLYIDRSGACTSFGKYTCPDASRENDPETGNAIFRENGRWGMEVRAAGKAAGKVIAAQYDNRIIFKGGRARVSRNGKWGFILPDGSEIVPLVYDRASEFSEDLAAVQRDGLWGYIDPKGAPAIPFRYTNASLFRNGEAEVTENSRRIVIDRRGRCIRQCY